MLTLHQQALIFDRKTPEIPLKPRGGVVEERQRHFAVDMHRIHVIDIASTVMSFLESLEVSYAN